MVMVTGEASAAALGRSCVFSGLRADRDVRVCWKTIVILLENVVVEAQLLGVFLFALLLLDQLFALGVVLFDALGALVGEARASTA